jgi:deoxyribonuclease V
MPAISGSSKLCLDVQYSDSTAVVAGVLFAEWADAAPMQEITLSLPTPGEYVPGAFYKRELPCLLSLIEPLAELPSVIIIDGYVWLGPESPGLGDHLYRALDKKVAVIGAAKTCFKSQDQAQQVFRGQSKRPLYVTSAGMGTQGAAQYILSMHGEHRIPTLIKRADQLARGLIQTGTGATAFSVPSVSASESKALR